MADFADLVSPQLVGHSSAVAGLAAAAADRLGLEPAQARAVRWAGYIHDLGRVAVSPRVWEKPSALTSAEWEQVRLQSYHGERALCRSPFLAALLPTATAHHERLDGSGYHRGSTGMLLSTEARVLAAADAYHAMTEPRAHRSAMSPDQAAEVVSAEARAGRLDAGCVAAVLDAAGRRVSHPSWPAGLTAREAQVVGLLARGLQTKQIARRLAISPKTADRHVQNAYAKMAVSTRASAAVFAMQHGLVPWGELPIVPPDRRP
jgi:HD-GYP domain-containing protein (c-di-GMP phosphodiesterase class II)